MIPYRLGNSGADIMSYFSMWGGPLFSVVTLMFFFIILIIQHVFFSDFVSILLVSFGLFLGYLFLVFHSIFFAVIRYSVPIFPVMILDFWFSANLTYSTIPAHTGDLFMEIIYRPL